MSWLERTDVHYLSRYLCFLLSGTGMVGGTPRKSSTWSSTSSTFASLSLPAPGRQELLSEPCVCLPQLAGMSAPLPRAPEPQFFPHTFMSEDRLFLLLDKVSGHRPSSCHSVLDSKIISRMNLSWGTWVIVSPSCSNSSLWLV